MTKNKTTSNRGFTLVELMVVVAIIGVLATVGAISVDRSMQNARVRDGAIAVAGVFRAATAKAQATGQVVMVKLDPANPDAYLTISSAPRLDVTSPGDVNSPVVTSCKLINNYTEAFNNPHNGLARRVFGQTDLAGPRVNFATAGPFAATRTYCVAPDGRVYDNRQPVSVSYGSCASRGVMVGLMTSPAGTNILSNSPNVGSGAQNLVCEDFTGGASTISASAFKSMRTQKAVLDAEREWHNLYLVEFKHNGTVTVEN